ncbi:MAG: redox-sensing transcriptional repressor [Halanaerobium sp. 4-GBenrich]|jgi:redox-sensing transcriptional repressor|uniref:Redox-sensing transcriptional repressor Rex n=1 Tax=Halanaerobium congolense TaxID=54121 RepID=A0A1G6JKX9_9FIRM|nr:redox-sensing transcriptional repressor Rex [Halanaerobium congolense]KXS49358.1 MAG: redox-sensing transcriptional repressor [Halanaerobium sp. T82-1]ODS49644.1 MAG: redox-sensing transcriptional repressor [Halanaerobium sp. 4-GBenrich]OEG61976.1 MAG: redox-sensing transcriptional repressor Rex [Halanaerobium sp. MDAL1]PUU93457.1 MAG: redox-sensing transcriptional repressor [Halanaerobium sp.]PTX16199.1 redox-sensing transcriptional repressor [Halanaerobium congolense]
MTKDLYSIPDIIMSRLPVYYQHLKKLKESNKTYVSSEELAKLTGFSSSLIRKDLSYFGTFGRKSYGYDIFCLFQQIRIIMGFNYNKKIILIGAGHLGQALAYNKGYIERGYKLTAVFDKNPKLIGLVINDLEIKSISDLENYLSENKVDAAILTVPEAAAQKTADRLVAAGIKAIWSFAEVPIKVPADVLVEEQLINEGLCKLSVKMNQPRINKSEVEEDFDCEQK